MSERLRIAITKGRLLDKSMDLFDQMGLNTAPVRDPGRRLIHEIPNYPLDAVLSKAPDVITYVEQGVCDLGIVGKDTILEKGALLLRGARPRIWPVPLCTGRQGGHGLLQGL